jgi:hypothetical protein
MTSKGIYWRCANTDRRLQKAIIPRVVMVAFRVFV